MARRKRKGEYVCNCYAYKFPHRMFGGRCSGHAWVEALWETTYGTSVCEDCALCYRKTIAADVRSATVVRARLNAQSFRRLLKSTR